MSFQGGRGFGFGGMHYSDENKPKPKLRLSVFRRSFSYLAPYKLQAGLILLTIAASTGLGVLPPLLLRQIIDHAIPGKDLTLLTLLVIGTIAVPLISGLIGVAQNYLNSYIGQSIMVDLRNHLYTHLQRMSLRFFTQTRAGELNSRLNNDVAGVQNAITGTIISIVSNIATLTFTVAIMFSLNFQLALLAIVILPLFVLPTRRVGRVRHNVSRQTQEKQAEMTSFMQETLSVSGYLLVRTFARQPYEAGRFDQLNRDLRALQIRQAMVGRWFFMFLGLMTALGPALLYWYGGWQAMLGTLSIGTILAFVAYLGNLYRPTSQLANVYVDLQGAMALFNRVFEYLDMPVEIEEKPNAIELPSLQGSIQFDHVTFSYPSEPPTNVQIENGTKEAQPKSELPTNGHTGDGARAKRESPPVSAAENGHSVTPPAPRRTRRYTLQDVSFHIEPGQLVALVGPSGAGKTTIAYLVPRLYDVQSGAVLIDGYDVRDLSLETLAEQIGMVTQETFLFHASIRENLLYARAGATEDEMIAAAKAAYIHDFVMSLPEGYDTIVGERGFRLSGGEKQRMAIARVILKNPRILILDEATSALDSRSEELIQAVLEPLMEGRTSLVIAHRLSTILRADKIIVVDQGRIVEQGTHSELLAQGGLYTRLYEQQFAPAL